MLAREGDVVLAEELTYAGLKAIAGLLRLRLQGVAIDGEGIVPEALDDSVPRPAARASCTACRRSRTPPPP